MQRVWLLLLMFVCPVSLFADDVKWGGLATRFVWDGEPPPPGVLRVDRDQAEIGKTVRDDSLLVHPKNRGVANVLVFLLPARDVELQVHPAYAKTANAKATLRMKGGRFEPRILLLRTSQTMVQKNLDKVAHHARIDFFSNPPR